MRTTFGLLTVVALWVATLPGCSPGVDVVRWTEEVRSHDGSTLLVEARARRARAPIVLFEHRGPVTSIEYYHRATGAYWKSPGAGFMPAVFDLVDGVPYIVFPVTSEIVCIWFDFPEKDLLVYRWVGQGWQRATFKDLPPSVNFNLLAAKFNERDREKDISGLVTLEIKEGRDGDRSGGIKGFLERRKEGTWCQDHKRRYESQGINQPGSGYSERPPRLSDSHGHPDAHLLESLQPAGGNTK